MVAFPAFIARIPGWVSLDDSPMPRTGRLDVVSSSDHQKMRVCITCADRSIGADLTIDLVRRLASLFRSESRIARASVDVALSGILSPQGGLIILTREPGRIVVDARFSPIQVSIEAVLEDREPLSSCIIVWRDDLETTIQMLSSIPGF